MSDPVVRDFIERFMGKAREDGVVMVPREKNLHALAFLQLLPFQAREVIMGLRADQCIGGPLIDHDGSEGEIFEFEVELEQTRVYIKLKLDRTEAKCISFHVGEPKP